MDDVLTLMGKFLNRAIREQFVEKFATWSSQISRVPVINTMGTLRPLDPCQFDLTNRQSSLREPGDDLQSA
jgi:hypothetical protein